MTSRFTCDSKLSLCYDFSVQYLVQVVICIRRTMSLTLICITLLSVVYPLQVLATKQHQMAPKPIKTWDALVSVLKSGNNFGSGTFNLTSAISKVDISHECRDSLKEYSTSLSNWETWALKMADANGRLPSGFLEGSLLSLGSFDECLKIRVGAPERFRGQYCLLALRSPLLTDFYDKKGHRNQEYEDTYGNPPEWVKEFMERSGMYLSRMLFFAGTCAPSTCDGKDVQTMVTHILKPFGFEVATYHCKREEPVTWSIPDIVAMSFLALIASLCFLGTAIDIINRCSNKDQQCTNCGLLLVFSVPANMTKLFGGGSSAKSFACLDGLRVVTFLWIVTGHTGAMTNTVPLGLFRNAFDMTKEGWSAYLRAIIILEGANVAVDTFFCISGFLLVSTTWKKLEMSGGKLNILKFMLNRYFRLTPPQVFIMALYILMYKLGSGPFWDYYVRPEYDNCKTSWGWNLLYMNNLFDNQRCIGSTWYLSALMQFHLIGVVFLWIAYRWPIKGIILCSATVVGTFAYLWETILENSPLPNIFSFKNIDYIEYYGDEIHIRSYPHLCSYVIGMAFGYIHLKQKTDFKTKYNLLGWFVAGVLAVYVIWGRYCFPEDKFAVKFYNVFHRAIWATSSGWLIHACCSGQGGMVDRFLSWPGFAIFSKLSFLAYLLQVPMVLLEQMSRREAISYGDLSIIFEVMGVTAATFIAAAVAYVTVEQPFGTITARIFNSK